jgi:hypothetical protein
MSERTSKQDQAFDFYELIQINDDVNNWGHGIRQEIIGKQGVIFGITLQLGELKCYVYVNDLRKTYGIAGKSLESLGHYEKREDLVPEFSAFFFGLFTYHMGYDGMAENSEFFAKFERHMTIWENVFEPQSIALCLEYALSHLEEVDRYRFVQNKYPDEVVQDYLIRYRDSFLRRAS